MGIGSVMNGYGTGYALYGTGSRANAGSAAGSSPSDVTAAESDAAQVEEQDAVIRDAVGNELQDGDAVTVIKDLKVKGSSIVIKVGTKAKSIRLLPDATDGHDIDCKLDGFGPMKLKSSVVKKA